MLTPQFPLIAAQIQTSGAVSRETLLVIFVGIIAFFFLALIIGLLGAVIYALRLKRDVMKQIESFKALAVEKAYPVIESTHGLIKDLTPGIKAITENVTEISHTVRAQVTDIDSTLSGVTARARAQAERVNGMVSSTLDTTSNVVSSVERGVRVPIREISGLLAGVKAGWDVLTQRSTPSASRQVKRAADHVEEMSNDLTAQAAAAARVNRPKTAATTESVSDTAADLAANAKRSVVEAGDDLATSAQSASARLKAETEEDRTSSTSYRRS